MWWVLPVVAVGAAAYLINELDNEVSSSKKRWEEKKEEVEKSLDWHKQNIESHLREAKNTCDFHELTSVHYSSFKVADEAYKLLKDAKITLDGINKALKNAKLQRDKLKLNRSKLSSKEEKKKLTEEINSLIELRKQLFLQKDEITSQREHFNDQVTKFNHRTRELKLLIRDKTGSRGKEWYEKLEERKNAKNR